MEIMIGGDPWMIEFSGHADLRSSQRKISKGEVVHDLCSAGVLPDHDDIQVIAVLNPRKHRSTISALNIKSRKIRVVTIIDKGSPKLYNVNQVLEV